MKSLKILGLTCFLFLLASPVIAEEFYLPDNQEIEIQEIQIDLKPDIKPVPINNNEWTKSDSQRQWAILILQVIDWGQTRTAALNPNRWEETNPILGKHPSRNAINQYFVVCIAGNCLISKVLPPKYRKIWQQASIVCQCYCVGDNFSIGIGTTF